jgi:hypothetical protein
MLPHTANSAAGEWGGAQPDPGQELRRDRGYTVLVNASPKVSIITEILRRVVYPAADSAPQSRFFRDRARKCP